jgi:hypothetical protein
MLIIIGTPLYGKETFSWPYKTYTDNKIKMTTVFVNKNADNKMHLDKLLKKGKLQVLCENETHVIIQISLIDLEKLVHKSGFEGQIWGLRDLNTYRQQCSEKEYQIEDEVKDKGYLHLYTHVDSIYAVSLITVNYTTKKSFVWDSYLTDFKGELECRVPEGEYKIRISTMTRYSRDEYLDQMINPFTKSDSTLKLEKWLNPPNYEDGFEYEHEEPIIGCKFKTSFTVNRVEIRKNQVTLLNAPMFTEWIVKVGNFEGQGKEILKKVKGDALYFWPFLQLISYEDYLATFKKGQEKIKIKGYVEIDEVDKLDSYKLSFLSAKNHLTFTQIEENGYFSVELYPGVYAVTIASVDEQNLLPGMKLVPPDIKTNVLDILINNSEPIDYNLKFKIEDRSDRRIGIETRYNYFTDKYKDL